MSKQVPMTCRQVGFTALSLSLFTGVYAVSGAELRGEATTVMELFTSQGCPFSPDADLLAAGFAERGDVVVLTYHVDYWDYVGWKDTFGSPANADLQRDYVSLSGARKLYTPQLVVAGSTAVLGSDEPAAVTAMEANRLTRQVDLVPSGDTLQIVVPEQDGARASTVWLVTYVEQATVTVERGENAGKTLSYDHIVTSRTPLVALGAGMGAQVAVEINRVLSGPATGLAVLVQEVLQDMPGSITGASAYEE